MCMKGSIAVVCIVRVQTLKLIQADRTKGFLLAGIAEKKTMERRTRIARLRLEQKKGRINQHGFTQGWFERKFSTVRNYV